MQLFEDESNIGEIIFKKDLSKNFNPTTRLFETAYGLDKRITSRTYTQEKYISWFTDSPQYFKLAEQEYLYEGLVKTQTVTNLIKELEHFEKVGLIQITQIQNPIATYFNIQKSLIVMFEIEKMFLNAIEPYNNISDENKIPQDILEVKNEYDALMTTITRNGYFIANHYKSDRTIDGETFDVEVYELHPKFIIEVTDAVYDSQKCDGILYHLTTKHNLNKIIQKGLIPRNQNSYGDNYPDRVYFFTKIPKDNFKKYSDNFAEQLKSFYKKVLMNIQQQYTNGKISEEKARYFYNRRYDYRDWIVLKINLKDKRSYKENDSITKYRFFDDPKTTGGIFTYENIDPICIETTPLFSHHFKDNDDFEDIIKF